jgi:hypothetical protein
VLQALDRVQRRVLWLATAEPDASTLREVAQIAQHTLEPILCSMSSIDRAVRRYYYGDQDVHAARLGEPLQTIPGAPRNGDGELTAAPVQPDGRRMDAIAELRTLLVRVEKQISAQGRAFRALVEILQEKGIVRRGELGTQTTKSK